MTPTSSLATASTTRSRESAALQAIANQNEREYQALVEAVESGRVAATGPSCLSTLLDVQTAAVTSPFFAATTVNAGFRAISEVNR